MEPKIIPHPTDDIRFNWPIWLGRCGTNSKLWFLFKLCLFVCAALFIGLYAFDVDIQIASSTDDSQNAHQKPTATPQPPPAPIVEKIPFVEVISDDKYAIFRTKPPTVPTAAGPACYQRHHIDSDHIKLFEDVLSARRRPHNGTNIFFHETSCLAGGVARLSVRQACAIESAARTNPNTNVFVLFASPAGFERGQPRAAVFEVLAGYANVHVRNLNLWTYTEDTPAERWMRAGELFNSSYLGVHMADMLRLVSLYKWGGTHIDLDFVVRRSFERLPATFASEELEGYVTNALLGFAESGVGHLMAKQLLAEFVGNFDGKIFAANGPALLKRVFHELCRKENLFECPLIKIYKKTEFFAVYGTVWEKLFDREHATESLEMVKDSLAVHFWNALSGHRPVMIGDGSAYEMLAREFCPKVFASVQGDRF